MDVIYYYIYNIIVPWGRYIGLSFSVKNCASNNNNNNNNNNNT